MGNSSEPIVGRWSAALAACALAATSAPALAQGAVSQPVVQPTPPAALGELNAALKDLARNPGNVVALLRAGWAALGLDDNEAALGIFRRAAVVAPQNGEVKAGLATALLRQGNPVDAVRLFAEAEAARAPMARYAADRGLALDLVGSNSAAQQFYRQALAQKSDAETTRRLALSQAIAGDQPGSDATLLPLLQHRDLAAYRTRAFALAILGKSEEAVSIAQTMLPATISGRLAPYLRYMPRLTRAQQAAAANLGQFPPASEIGRDDPRIAAFSAAEPRSPQVASAAPDARLVPTGAPLGKAQRGQGASRKAATRAPKAQPKASNGDISVSYAPLQQAAPQATARPAQQPALPPPPRVAAAVQPPIQAPTQAIVASQGELPPTDKPVLVAALAPSSAPPAPPVDQASAPPVPAPSPVPVAAPAEVPAPEPETASLAETFAAFSKLPQVARPAAGAVDISKFTPIREPKAESPKPEPAKAKAKAKPKPPAHPRRFWVQVATGRDLKALAFDWRRLQREGGSLLAQHDAFTAKWGRTRRLLTGPYKTEAEADKAVSALKKKGLDAFEFTSDEGEEVAPLD
jgi:tetratricopeptide (TPR) repeat protein